MKNKETIERIKKYEEIYNRCREALCRLSDATEEYKALLPELEDLESYYSGPLWLSDFDADKKGELPLDLKRGILSEDAIFDLLTDEARIKRALRDSEKNKEE